MNPRSDRIGPHAPIRPDTYYGVSKAFGEAIGSLYAEKWGVSTVCLRIGSCLERPLDKRHLSTWLSPGDAVALVGAALDAPVTFKIVYGISANTRGWWDMTAATELGYQPHDNAEVFADQVADDPSEFANT
jgi:uronate dehydrogenase